MNKLQNKGFSIPKVLLLLAGLLLVALAIVLVFFNRDNQKPNQNSTYKGWQAYTSSKEGLSFKYPPGWVLTSTPCTNQAAQTAGDCVSILSPTRNGSSQQFLIVYSYNMASGTVNSLAYILESRPLAVSGYNALQALQLVTVSASPEDTKSVGGMFLVDHDKIKAGATLDDLRTSIASRKNPSAFVVMSASLAGAKPASGNTLSQYQNQPDYSNVIKVFESLSY